MRAEVFVLGAEQGHRDLALLQRVFDILQGFYYLGKRLLCGRAAGCEVGRKLLCVQAQVFESLVCGVAAVHGADGKFLDGVADFVNGESAGVCAVYKGLHELVSRQAQFGIFRRVLTQHVQQVAVLVGTVLRTDGNEVVCLCAADAELVHQGRCRAAGFGKLKAERVPQQVAVFGGLLQGVTYQAGVGLCGGQGFVYFADTFPEVVSPYFVGNAAHGGQFFAGCAGHGGQLVVGADEVGTHLGDFLAALQSGRTQGGYGAGGSCKARFQGASCHVGRVAHGVAQAAGLAFGVVGRVAGVVGGLAGLRHGVGHTVGRSVGAAGRAFQLCQFRFGLRYVRSCAIHGRFGLIQGNGQVVQFFGAGLATFLCGVQLCGHHFDLFSLGGIDRGQLFVLITQRVHAAFLALKCGLGRG